MNVPEVTIYGFKASDNPKYCKLFSKGRNAVLYDHGFAGIVSNDDYWHGLDHVYVFLAFDMDGLPTGGIRIEKKIQNVPLDLEKKLNKHQEVSKYINQFRSEQIGEACGLWNSKNALSLKLAILFARLVAAIAPRLGYDKIFSFSSTYTYRLALSTGAHMVKSLGNNGVFNFPSETYRSSIFLCDDLEKYSEAKEHDRSRMLSLKENPNQTFIENNIPSGLQVRYEIKI